MPTNLEDIAGLTNTNNSTSSLQSQEKKPSNKANDGNIPRLEDTERMAIEAAIKHSDGNIPQAAKALGISASTIYRKIKQWQE